VATGANLANAAVATNTANTLIKRDGNGNAAITRLTSTVAVTSFSATPTFDLSQGNINQITLAGDVTSSSVSNLAAGFYVFDIIQNASVAHTFVWPTNVFGGGTVSATLGKHNPQIFYCDGSNLYALGDNRGPLG
jgi:hypothetical protein